MRSYLILTVVLGLAVAAATASSLAADLWRDYKAQFGKRHANADEETLRSTLLNRRLGEINAHNERFRNGEAAFELAPSRFSDWTEEERRAFLDLRPSSEDPAFVARQRSHWHSHYYSRHAVASGRNETTEETPLPDSVDWRSHNNVSYVTNVKDQAGCGSCWSFSTVGALEAQYNIFHTRLDEREGRSEAKDEHVVYLSEQEMIDCSWNNFGCNAGYIHKAFEYMINYGINFGEDYPYRGSASWVCKKVDRNGALMHDYYVLPDGSEPSLQRALAQHGPVSVAIDASDQMMEYKSGVFKGRCSSEKLNHAVLAVGYGVDKELGEFWIVKNSWGEKWGEGGYIRLARNAGNMCGIASQAMYPIIHEN